MRDFQQLARLSEADGHLQLKLKQLLKLSKEKWDASCDHAKMAVQVPSAPSIQSTRLLRVAFATLLLLLLPLAYHGHPVYASESDAADHLVGSSRAPQACA